MVELVDVVLRHSREARLLDHPDKTRTKVMVKFSQASESSNFTNRRARRCHPRTLSATSTPLDGLCMGVRTSSLCSLEVLCLAEARKANKS